jgi:hypothetical protein
VRSAVYRAAAGPDRQEVPRALAEATEPVATANPGLVAETCKLCDILINRFY